MSNYSNKNNSIFIDFGSGYDVLVYTIFYFYVPIIYVTTLNGIYAL